MPEPQPHTPCEGPPPLAHRALGALLRGAMAAVRRLPAPLAYGLADVGAFGLLVATVVHERRVRLKGRGLYRNLRIAFGDGLTPAMRRRLVIRWARHMAWLVAEFCRIPRIDAHNLGRYVDVTALERLRAVAAEGRGVICASGHMGFFELAGHAASLAGLPVTFVSRPLPIRPLDDAVRAVRSAGGQQVISKWGVLWSLKKALERGRCVGLAADENERAKPVFVPFLGTQAATSQTTALLHLATGAPIAVVSCERTGRERYAFRVWDVIRHAPSGDKQGDIVAICARVSAALSQAILARPEQWFWGSRRFYTRPDGEVPGPDGLPPRTPDCAWPRPPDATAKTSPPASSQIDCIEPVPSR